MGRAAAFSFYPGKNLGACGEAGAVTMQEASIAASIRRLRDHGQSRKYHHDVEGYNGRLDAIQAGVLSAKLAKLPDWNQQRRERAGEYGRLFGDASGVIAPHEPHWSRAVWHLYVIRVEDRDGLIAHLSHGGIGTGIHYPIPLHLQPAYKSLGYQIGDFPITERVSAEIVSLPMFPNLSIDQQRVVVDEVLRFVGSTVAKGLRG
jgi:dTDP-4-amino-4,6-dideoxygalactose transaminase